VTAMTRFRYHAKAEVGAVEGRALGAELIVVD
jgi:hypothetical protein